MKNNLTKFLVLVLAAFMVVTTFVACTKDPSVIDPEETPADSASEELPPEETEPPIEDTTLTENGSFKYKVVRPQSATKGEIDATSTLVKALKEKVGGEVLASDDWINETLGYTESEYEILIGKTNREASDKIYSNMRINDFAVSIVGKKIVIAAYNDEKLAEAISYFLEKLTDTDGSLQFLADDSVINKAEYEVDEITIGGKALSQFKIVYKSGAAESIKNSANAIAAKIYEYGYSIPVVMDSVDESECEIVVGAANRGDAKAEAEKLLSYDYNIYLDGTKLYVLSGTHSDAVNNSTETLFAKLGGILNGGKIAIDASNIKAEFYSDAYKTKQLLINGVDVKDYTVVYAHNDKLAILLADKLCDMIEEVCGRRLNLVSDSRAYSGDKEILVGYSKRLTSAASAVGSRVTSIKKGEYLLYSEDGFIYAGGKEGETAAVTAAMNILFDALDAVSDPNCAKIDLSVTAGKTVGGSKYSIITYNDGDNSYQNIADRMTIIKEYMPDLICFQETQTPHAKKYSDSLREYDYVLYDNDGTTYNSQPVFWKKDKFERVDSGIKWLSNTPDVRSKFEESDYTRSFTYVILKDKVTGEKLVVISTHTDYVQAAVEKQTAILMELTQEFRNMPMVILGDFNMRDNSVAYQNMSNECFIDAGRYLNAPTKASIDFCFVDVTRVVPTAYKVINDHELSKVASDHDPVYVEFMIGFN